jgi:hypothetical protein
MAIGVYVAAPQMTAEIYNETVKRLKKAGAGHPPGRSYHATFGTKDRLMVFDVWTSQAAFDKFGKTLMPILQSLGVEDVQPQVMPIHNVIVPKPKDAKPAKRTTKKRGAKR